MGHGKGKQRKQQDTSVSPQWCRTAGISKRAWTAGSRGRPGAGAGPRDRVPAPLLTCPPQGKSGNWPYFGHFSQLGSFSLMPRTFLNPALITHPSKQPLIKRKEQREGVGGGAAGVGKGGHRDCSRDALAAQRLLARSDRLDGQQAPELEVLDHGELLQAL